MRKDKILLLATILASLLIFARNAAPQAVWGTIDGYVTDATKAAIPGATVTITEVTTGIVNRVVTDSTGLYNVTHLNPGEYTVSVEKAGFERFSQQHIILRVDSTVRMNATLQVGSVTQQVTVTAAPPPLQTQKTDITAIVGEKSFQSLPTAGHNLSKLYDLAPGTVEGFMQLDAGESPGGAVSVTVNGEWFGSNEYLIDGVEDTACCFSNQQVFVPPEDSISELKMDVDDYDPEFGNSAGLVAQYVTKSGTNQVHGSAYWANENSSTFAADPFTQKIPGTGPFGKGLGVAPYNQNWGNVSLGGPIRKDKMWIFGDFQLMRELDGATLTATVPTTEWRNGDFGDVATTDPIYNPLTGNSDGTGRAQFINNVIPASLINPVSTKLLNLLPLPNTETTASDPNDLNYVGTGASSFQSDLLDVRWDYQISDKDKMFFRYMYMYTDLYNPPLFGVVAGGPAFGGLAAEKVPTNNHDFDLDYTHSFSPNLFTEVRAGYLTWKLEGYQTDANLETNNQVGIPNINTGSPITGGLAGLTIDGPVGSFVEGPGDATVALPRLDLINIPQFVDNWTFMKGNHEFQWGTDIHRNQEDLFTINAHTEGLFDFNQLITANPSVPNSGLGAATFLLGLPDSFSRGIYNFIPKERQWRDAVYGQDIWKATRKLTADLGVRWDYFGPDTTPIKGGLANFDPDTGNILLANLGNVSSSADVDPYYKGISPRIGLAYQLTNKTVIRAGLGRSYFASNYWSTFQQLSTVYPIAPTQSTSQTTIYTPIFPIQQGPPSPPPSVFAANGIEVTPPNVSVTYHPTYQPTEHIDQWNFTVEHEISRNLTASLGYVGNKGTNLVWDYNMNAAPIGSGPILNRQPYYQLYGLDQGIGDVMNGGNSNYNSLQVTVTKRFSEAYSLSSNFTWSKAMDDEIVGSSWAAQGTDPYDREGTYGPGVDINRPVVWTLSHNWELPYGQGMRFGSNATGIKKWILGGWQFNGITIVEDGFPISAVSSDSSTLNAGWGQRPNRISGVPLYPSHQTTSEWFNPAAFQDPSACCVWGNAANGSLQGPGLIGTDWAFWKVFTFKTPLNEDTQLQFRWENYNFLNHPDWGNPDTAVDTSLAGEITGLGGLGGGLGYVPMRRMEFTVRLTF